MNVNVCVLYNHENGTFLLKTYVDLFSSLEGKKNKIKTHDVLWKEKIASETNNIYK